MSNRLPIPGQDNGTWGDILNAYLEVSHNSDGTLNTSEVTSALPSPIPTTNLGSGTASSSNFLRGDGTWAVPSGAGNMNTSTYDPAGIAQQVVGLTAAQTLTNKSISGSQITSAVANATNATTASTVTTIPALTGDVTSSGNATTLTSSTNVESIISANTTVAGALQKTNNLSDVSDAGTSRANVHVPTLTPAACVTTTNVSTLSGLNAYDGYTLTAGDLVLLTGQTTTSQNGLWSAASGSWTRPTEMGHGVVMKARTVAIIQGTSYAGTTWLLQTNGSVTVDTTAQTWVSQLPSSVVSSNVLEPGNLGTTYTANFSAVPNERMVLVGTLNANCTITLENQAAGDSLILLLTQNGTGGYTLNISNGLTSQPVTIPTIAGSSITLQVDCPDATNIYVTLLSPGPTGVNIADIVHAVTTSGSAQTIPDPTVQGNGTISYITLTAACTLTFPSAAAGKEFAVALLQDTTGSRTVTWPSNIKWMGATTPTLTTTASKTDTFSFVCVDGTNWLGVQTGASF